MKKIHKIATYFVVGALMLTGYQTFNNTMRGNTAVNGVQAAKEDSTGVGIQTAEEPVAGIELALDEVYRSTDNANKAITKILSADTPSEYDNMAFAKVTNYVNIRSKASENGEILGKLYNDSAATILSKKDGWYKIKSGSVTGYIKAEFLVAGEEAAKLAKSLGSRVAEVTTTTLKVREKPSTEATILTLVAQGDDFKVIKELDGWVKVYLSERETGFVSTDYVKLLTVYEEAVSIEEEQQNQEDEIAASNQSSSSSNTSGSSNNSSPSNASDSSNTSGSPNATSSDITSSHSYPSRTSSGSSLGNNIAAFAQQFVGNPYVWGGTSLTNGTDCSGFTQSVFAHFGISIPRTSRTQATGGSRVSLDNLHAGDLIFYARNGTINHVAIYIGNAKVISASSPSTGIRITNYNYRQPYKAVSYIN